MMNYLSDVMDLRKDSENSREFFPWMLHMLSETGEDDKDTD